MFLYFLFKLGPRYWSCNILLSKLTFSTFTPVSCFITFSAVVGLLTTPRMETIRVGIFLPFPTYTRAQKVSLASAFKLPFVWACGMFFFICFRPAFVPAPNFLHIYLLALSTVNKGKCSAKVSEVATSVPTCSPRKIDSQFLLWVLQLLGHSPQLPHCKPTESLNKIPRLPYRGLWSICIHMQLVSSSAAFLYVFCYTCFLPGALSTLYPLLLLSSPVPQLRIIYPFLPIFFQTNPLPPQHFCSHWS